MRKLYKVIFTILVMGLLFGCDKSAHNDKKFEFFMLRQIEGDNGIMELVKDDSPIFTEDDMRSYDWDTHTIIFTEEFLADRGIIDEVDPESLLYGGSQVLGEFYPDQFAIFLDGEELYRGYLQLPLFLSFMPSGPMIFDVDKGIEIKYVGNVADKTDPRDNENLYNFLKDRHLLSE